MRNAKLPGPVANSSGVEVLKDWTTLKGDDGFQVDLLAGLDATSLDYNGLSIEFKDVRCYGGSGSGSGSNYVSLKFRNAGRVDTTGSRSRALVRAASGGYAGNVDNSCCLFAAGFGVDYARAEVLLGFSSGSGQAAWYSEAFNMSTEPTLGSDQYLSTVASFYNTGGLKPVELVLDSPAGFAGTTFTYRIIRK